MKKEFKSILGGNQISVKKDTDADLTLSELEKLADEIRIAIIGDVGVTLPQYVQAVSTINANNLGYRLVRAIQNEPKIEVFFPDEVYSILYNRFKDLKNPQFNWRDENFLRANASYGILWLKKHFYSSSDFIYEKTKQYNIVMVLSSHKYTPLEEEFIRRNSSKGYKWISEKMGINQIAIASKIRRMGIRIKGEKNHEYTPEEDEVIINNTNKGSAWLAQKIGVSPQSIRSRIRTLNKKVGKKLNLTAIHHGKEYHKFTSADDFFIMINANKGAIWIANSLNLCPRSVYDRAQKLKVGIKRKRHIYTSEENNFIKQNIDKGVHYLIKQIGVSERAIKCHAKLMGLNVEN